MSWIDDLLPRSGRQSSLPQAQQRIVPVQPAGVAEGRVYLGPDIGAIFYQGKAPQVGDLVTVVGDSGGQVALTGREIPALTDPIFRGGCRCRCPGSTNAGVIFYCNSINWTGMILAFHGGTGALLLRDLMPDCLNPQGIVIDPSPPNLLYVLDNRKTYSSLQTDSSPDLHTNSKNWWTLLIYTVGNTALSLEEVHVLPGANWETEEHGLQPLADRANPLSVVNGTLWITGVGSPAQFYTWDGGSFGIVNLLQNGAPLEDEPVGQVVTIPDRPAPKTSLFVATLGNQIVRFNSDGIVQETLFIDEAFELRGVMTVCNRLAAIEGFGISREEDDGDFDLSGAGADTET